MPDTALNTRVSNWGKRIEDAGQQGLVLAVDCILKMADGSRDWDAAARFLQVTAPVDAKKPDTAHRVFRLMLASYFGTAIKLTTVKKTGPGSHYTGYRFTMDPERCPDGQPVTPTNHWGFVTKALADKRNITRAAFLSEIKAELTGENVKKVAAPDAARLAKRLVKEDVKLSEFIGQLTTAYKAAMAEANAGAVEHKPTGLARADSEGNLVDIDELKRQVAA